MAPVPVVALVRVLAPVLVMVLLFALVTPAGAVAPPRAGSHRDPAPLLQRWPTPRPGQVPRAAAALARRAAASGDRDAAGAAEAGGAPDASGSSKSLGAAPVSGRHVLPVLPGGFADRAGAVSTGDLQHRFTGLPSVYRYFEAASGGRLAVIGEVQGWVRAPGSAQGYAGDHNGLDLWDWQHNAGWFVHDVVAAADAAGLDWGRWDNDGPDGVPNSGDDDGVVDCVVVLHAGPGGECGTTDLWSHAFFLAGWGYGAYTTRTPAAGGGFIAVDDYVLAPAQACDGGPVDIGVICHEYGHVLGLPDLYDTGGGRAGIGGWGLMGTGSWGGDGQSPDQPTLPCAWSRAELGWCEVVDVVEDGPLAVPATTVEDRVYAVRDTSLADGEVFLLEHRRRAGMDASLPGEGLLVWHVDHGVIAAGRAQNTVNAGAILGVALEQADGRDHLALATGGNRGDGADPWPGTAGRDRFSAATWPASDANAGAETAVALSAIGPLAAALTEPLTLQASIGVAELDRIPPAVTVLAPMWGEVWTYGDVQTVRWEATDAGGVAAVDLHLSRDGGATYAQTLATALANTGSWSGSLRGGPGEDLRLRVTAHDATGNAGQAVSEPFALRDLYPPGVVLAGAPLAGESVVPGQRLPLSWQAADNVGVDGVSVELSCDGGVSWQETGIGATDAVGSADWMVPDATCPRAVLRARARDAAGNVGEDRSPEFRVEGGTTTAVPDAGRLALGPCVPNPFNPRAVIAYTLPSAGSVTVSVHDARGRRLAVLVQGSRPAGRHEAVWNGRDRSGRDLPSGVYWVRAQGPGGAAVLRVTLVR